MTISREEFTIFSELVKRTSGLMLTNDKTYLLESRLSPIAKKHGLTNLSELAQKVRMGRDRNLEEEITDAMTTNESFFFRDVRPFDLFREVVLPSLMQQKSAQKRIRIWSAASSSGQEAYSLAITIKEMGPKLAGWNFEILGTDISREMITRSNLGQYTQFEVQRGLPITHLVKYFTQKGDRWEVKPEIKQMVQFREFNLLGDMRGLGQFDVVFCRNVLIYFDPPTKTKVLSAIRRQMHDGSFLFLGGAETVLGVTDAFEPMKGQRGLYVPMGSSIAAKVAVG